MLEKFELAVELVSSAEEALAHLSYNQPAVIFLDHHMAGMSGMEALKTIKANPGTALLPVVMYTAEKDELFVGQARALGALDILSKSTMQPSNLEKVLESLNIHPRGTVAESSKTVVAASRATVPVLPQPSDLQHIRAQVGRLFEIHIAEVRNQIDNSTQFVVKRLAGILENKLQRDKFNEGAFLSRVTAASAAETHKSAFFTQALVGIALLVLGFCLYLLLQMQSDFQQAAKNVQAAVNSGVVENRHIAETVNQLVSDKKAEESRISASVLPRAIELLQNMDFQFGYGESPLNPQRVANLAKMVSFLTEGGYAGPLNVDIHFGNFCMEPGTVANTWRVARGDMPASSCRMLKDLNQKFTTNDFVSASYQGFQQTSAPVQDGRIRLQLNISGFADPVVEYPIMGASTSAAEWNSAALKNNRVLIRLSGPSTQ
jgi:CheY-like chemotaxis protein